MVGLSAWDFRLVSRSPGTRRHVAGPVAAGRPGDVSGQDSGRNRVETYVEDLHDAALGRLRVEGLVRAALAESRVGVEYQPIVGLAGITALEALVRVPASEPSAASAVVQVAEQTGLIAGLESQVLGVVVRDVAGWQEQGVNTRVHINVSRSRLLDPGFPCPLPGCTRPVGATRSNMLRGR